MITHWQMPETGCSAYTGYWVLLDYSAVAVFAFFSYITV